jgi:hypothetical protein
MTENSVRVGVLRFLVLNFNPQDLERDDALGAAVESLRNLLFEVLHSDSPESEMREAAHLVLKLESKMKTDRELVVGDHYLDSLFQFLEKQLHSPLDPRPDWHEESIERTLAALVNLTSRNGAQLWERGIIQHLLSALGADHSAGVRQMALRVVRDFGLIQTTPDNIETISSFLRDFWDQLPQGSQGTCAKSYADALSSFSKAAGAHPLIFRDHWKSLQVIVDQKLEGSSELKSMILWKLRDSLPALIRESGNTDASRAWLAMARRTLTNSWHADSLAKIEEAAAEVLGLEAGRVEEVPVASGSQS